MRFLLDENMTGRMSRNKGARGENELAKLLSDELGFVVKRKLGQARDGADDIEVGPYRIECKRQETLAIMKWCRQVEACTKPGEIPTVVFRQNGEQWRVVLRLEHFLPLLREHLAELPSQPPSTEPL
jgi:Holliday junction resolvase